MSCLSMKSLAKVLPLTSQSSSKEDKEKQEKITNGKKEENTCKRKEKKERSNLDRAVATTPYFAFHVRPGLR
ncbi:hypothetical protein FCM35_KLT13930 [Carex littledalei]|uniref:DUF4770 domain-containing protein n=1 Tax=Carex littledalei TaxID=544730 RepID=A0A833QFL7_9POAL|nr:hypothetical protein FCM35_KLT13930 [Carex littledalei]